jgi:Zn-dependent alcohol dehydrogenase
VFRDSHSRDYGAVFLLIIGVQGNWEVLVEVKYTGICHTVSAPIYQSEQQLMKFQDIVVRDGGMPIGEYPAVLGHEGVGIIQEVGTGVKDNSLSPGDTVLLSFHTCGQCGPCEERRLGGCPHMTEANFLNTARSGDRGKTPISLPDGTHVHGQSAFGLGRATAFAFAKQGASVVCADISPLSSHGQATHGVIMQEGGRCSFVKADVSSEESVEALIENTVADFGKLDMSVKCF